MTALRDPGSRGDGGSASSSSASPLTSGRQEPARTDGPDEPHASPAAASERPGWRGLVPMLVALLLLGGLLRGGGVLRERLDLKPRTDALEYALGASSLVEQGRYVIRLGDAEYAPRYPPGFSILAAPFVAAAGGDPTSAWRAAFGYGLLAVVLAVLLGLRVGGLPGAAAAGLLVAVSPAAVEHSTLAMSATAALFLSALALWALVAALQRERPLRWLALSGVAVGLGILVRPTSAVFLLPGLVVVLGAGGNARERLARAAALTLPALVGLGLLLGYNWATFGAPMRTGYHHWIPSVYVLYPEYLFSSDYWHTPFPTLGEEGHLAVYLGALTGWRGTLVPRALGPLLVLGLVRAWRRRREPDGRVTLAALATSVPVLTGFHLLYLWQGVRFLVPLLAPLALLVAQGAACLVELLSARATRGGRWRVWAAPLALACVLVLPVLPPLVHAIGRLAADEPRRPALVQVLPEADRLLPASALCVIGMPWTLAHRALGPGRELWMASRDHSDELINTIAIEGVASLDGREHGIPSLAALGAVEEEVLARLVGRVESGEPVFLLTAQGEGAPGPGVDALRARVRTEELMASWPLRVERLLPRSK